jgi:hypothetical protein
VSKNKLKINRLEPEISISNLFTQTNRCSKRLPFNVTVVLSLKVGERIIYHSGNKVYCKISKKYFILHPKKENAKIYSGFEEVVFDPPTPPPIVTKRLFCCGRIGGMAGLAE